MGPREVTDSLRRSFIITVKAASIILTGGRLLLLLIKAYCSGVTYRSVRLRHDNEVSPRQGHSTRLGD